MSMTGMIRGDGLCVAVLVLASGCNGPLNESAGLRGVEALPFLEMETASILNDSPSLNDPSRKSWPTVTVQVPIHQTQNERKYRKSPVLVDDLARQRGDYPTVASALRNEPMGAGHWAEAAVEYTSPATGLVGFGGGLIIGEGPWSLRSSPAGKYQRVPTHMEFPGEDQLRFHMEAE
jgi:hypothetical protein